MLTETESDSDQTGDFSTRESGQVEPAFQTCNSIVETVANNIFLKRKSSTLQIMINIKTDG